MAQHGCLVACLDWERDGTGRYYVCTRQLMTPQQAEKYVSGIAADRKPIIIYDNIDWEIRPIKSYKSEEANYLAEEMIRVSKWAEGTDSPL